MSVFNLGLKLSFIKLLSWLYTTNEFSPVFNDGLFYWINFCSGDLRLLLCISVEFYVVFNWLKVSFSFLSSSRVIFLNYLDSFIKLFLFGLNSFISSFSICCKSLFNWSSFTHESVFLFIFWAKISCSSYFLFLQESGYVNGLPSLLRQLLIINFPSFLNFLLDFTSYMFRSVKGFLLS